MEITGIALQGLEHAQNRLGDAASRLAQIGIGQSDGSPVDSVDLSEQTIALMDAKNEFTVDARLIQVADNMQKQLLDLLA